MRRRADAKCVRSVADGHQTPKESGSKAGYDAARTLNTNNVRSVADGHAVTETPKESGLREGDTAPRER